MNDRFRFRVWGVDIQNYIQSSLFVIDKDGELRTTCAGMQKVPQSSFVIEQCTGRKDIHGKLIYEGDIVSLFYKKFTGWNYSEDEVKGVIRWDGWRYFLTNTRYGDFPIDNDEVDSTLDINILGNIHENPELLEG